MMVEASLRGPIQSQAQCGGDCLRAEKVTGRRPQEVVEGTAAAAEAAAAEAAAAEATMGSVL